jgi:hypothetical protein
MKATSPSEATPIDRPSNPALITPRRSLRNWALGGSALVGAAGAIPSQSATVETDLSGNGVSMTNGTFASSLNLDLTGDGTDDFSSASLFGAAINQPDGQGISLQIGGLEARAFHGKKVYSWSYSTTNGKFEKYNSTFTGFSLKVGYSSFVSYEPQELTGFIPVKFADAAINGGAESNGWVQVRVASTGVDDHSIDLVKLIYDDASTEAPDLFGGDGWTDGGDVVTVYDGDGGPYPVYAFFTRGLMEKNFTPVHLPKAALLKKKRLQSQIEGLERQAASIERRLAALNRQSSKAKPFPRMIQSPSRKHQNHGETRILTRKLDGLRKKIHALKQRLRSL